MMHCVLCRQPVNLLELDPEGFMGLPAHTYCARDQRAAMEAAELEAVAMVMAEPDPRRHRQHLRPVAAA